MDLMRAIKIMWICVLSTAAIRLDECDKGRGLHSGRVVCDIETSGYIVCEGKYASVRRLEQTGNGILRGLNCTPAQLPALSTLKIERSSATCDNFKFPGARVFLMKKECGIYTTVTTTTEATNVTARWPLFPVRIDDADQDGGDDPDNATSSSTSSDHSSSKSTTTAHSTTTIRFIFRASLSTTTYIYVFVIVSTISAIGITATCVFVRMRRRQARRQLESVQQLYTSIEDAPTSSDTTLIPETIGMVQFARVPDSPRRRSARSSGSDVTLYSVKLD